jgi:hypothetical protein
MDKLAGPDRAKHIKNGRHPRQKIRKLAGLYSYKDNSDFVSLRFCSYSIPLSSVKKI